MCRTIGKDLLFFGGSIVVIRVLAVLLVEGAPQADALAPWLPTWLQIRATNKLTCNELNIPLHSCPICYPRVVHWCFLHAIKVISDHYQGLLLGSWLWWQLVLMGTRGTGCVLPHNSWRDSRRRWGGEGEGVIAIHVQHINEPHRIKGNGTQQW